MKKRYLLFTCLTVLVFAGLLTSLVPGIIKGGQHGNAAAELERSKAGSAPVGYIHLEPADTGSTEMMDGVLQAHGSDGAAKVDGQAGIGDSGTDTRDEKENGKTADQHEMYRDTFHVDENMRGEEEDEGDIKRDENDPNDKIDILFTNEPPILLNDQDGDGITIIAEPKKTMVVDPQWAEKLRKGAEEAKKLLTGLFRTELSVMQTEVGLELDFSLENISGEDQQYYSGSSQRYDYMVYDSHGNEVYRWSNDKCFATVIRETLHKKGERIVFDEIWGYTDNDGNRVSPGEYSVVMRIIARRHDGMVIDPDELTAKEYFNVD